MFAITVSRQFAAAHAIRLPDGVLEPLHGHNWSVEVTVQAEQLNGIETVMDFHDLEALVDAVIAPFQNKNLNELEPFAGGVNPTAERVAWWIGTSVTKRLPAHVRLRAVRVGEAPGCVARYEPEGD